MKMVEPFVSVDGLDRKFHPIQIRPSFRTVAIVNDEDYDGDDEDYVRHVKLAFPYMQFFMVDDRVPKVTWSMESVSSLEDRVSVPLLPNMYHSGNVCLYLPEETNSINMCEYFWGSHFTPNEFQAYYAYSDKNQDFYNKWERRSAAASHPMEVFENFNDNTFPLKNFMKFKWSGRICVKRLQIISHALQVSDSISMNELEKVRCMLSEVPGVEFEFDEIDIIPLIKRIHHFNIKDDVIHKSSTFSIKGLFDDHISCLGDDMISHIQEIVEQVQEK